jgi:hypothetical protein
MSLGLNWHIDWKRKWIRLIWVWCNPQGDCKRWYFRFRLRIAPHFLWEVDEYNAIEGFFWECNYRLVTWETFEDVVVPWAKDNGRNIEAVVPRRITIQGHFGPYKTWEYIVRDGANWRGPTA